MTIVYDPESEVDRYFKTRPFLIKLRENFLKIEPENNFNIDEMTVPIRGPDHAQNNTSLRNQKVGFKIFVRCGKSGIAHNFTLYGGETNFSGVFLPPRCLVWGRGR